jgi:hypothetical protein
LVIEKLKFRMDVIQSTKGGRGLGSYKKLIRISRAVNTSRHKDQI